MLLLACLVVTASSAVIDSQNWNITAPPHGVYVQYDGSKTGNARFSGLAIDVLTSVAARANASGTPFSYDLHLPASRLFHGAVEEVANGTKDLIWAGTRLTPSRMNMGLHFTTPYSSSSLVLIRSRNPRRYSMLHFDNMDELKALGLKACATIGTAQHDFVSQKFPTSIENVDPIVDAGQATNLSSWREAMDSGDCDAVVADKHDAAFWLGLEQNCDLVLVSEGKTFWQGSLGIGARPGLESLADELSTLISGVTTSGETTLLLSKHTGSSSCVPAEGVKGRHFHIITVVDPPFVITDRFTGCEGNARFDGFIPAMIKEVSERAGFTYTLHESSDGTYNGGVSDVQNRGLTDTGGNTIEADMYWASYFITEARLKNAEFSSPFLDTGLVLVSRTQYEGTSRVGPLAPFTDTLWILIVFMAFCAGLVFWLLESAPRHYPSASNPDIKFQTEMVPPFITGKGGIAGPAQIFKSLRNNIIFTTYTAFTGVTGIRTHLPVTFAGQIFSMAFNFMCVVIISSYTANLTSFLTKEASSAEFHSIEQMIASRKTLCIKSNTAYGSYIRHQHGEQLRHGGHLIEKQNLTAMIHAVLDKECDAFADDRSHADYATHIACVPNGLTRAFGSAARQEEASMTPCPLTTTGQTFWHQNMGVGVTKDYPGVANHLSTIISDMRSDVEPVAALSSAGCQPGPTFDSCLATGCPAAKNVSGIYSSAWQGGSGVSLLERMGTYWFSNGLKDEDFKFEEAVSGLGSALSHQEDAKAVSVAHVRVPVIVCFIFGLLMLLKHTFDHYRADIIYERAHRFNLPKKSELELSFVEYSSPRLVTEEGGADLTWHLSRNVQLMSIENFARYFKEVEHRKLDENHKNRSIRSMRSLFPGSRGLNGELFGGRPMISKGEFIDWMYVRGFTIEVMKVLSKGTTINTIAGFANRESDLEKVFEKYHDLMERSGIEREGSSRSTMLTEQQARAEADPLRAATAAAVAAAQGHTKTLPAMLLFFLVHEVYDAKFKGEHTHAVRSASQVNIQGIYSRRVSLESRSQVGRRNSIDLHVDDDHVTFHEMTTTIKDLKDGKFAGAAAEMFGIRKQSAAFFLRNARAESEAPWVSGAGKKKAKGAAGTTAI
jgi:ABC-type amino acid transport substrate-binding protein